MMSSDTDAPSSPRATDRVIGVGTTLNERFTLDRELGQGGMGTVYRATDQLLGRNVAIKFLKDSGTEEEANQIRLEAQILARLLHDKIVRLYDFGESEGNYFLIMEEVNGPSFSNRWRDLLLADRLRICGEVAEALHYAHLQGVIHRDVKPGNVLLTQNDDAKLSDFGLSLIASDRMDQSGTLWGTPLYMSPEQVQGKPLDHRTDLYSVGVMLYECATGEVPFAGHAMSVLNQHVSARPTAPRFKNPEIWSTLECLILSLLQKNPSKRPASGSVVALGLLEEAERARRLERINPGPRRSDPRSPLAPPPSGPFSVGKLRADFTSSNGTGRVEPGTNLLSATEPPPSALPRHADSTGASPRAPGDRLDRSGSDRTSAPHSDDHPIAREMLTKVLATPIVITPEERYLCGHYLAYLLGGSRRRGIFLRRPLDAKNSDRARFLLAMTWLSCVGPTQEAIERATRLLEDRPDVRAALSPVVVIKYLASRDTPSKRKWFREVCKRLKEASAHARKAIVNANGQLKAGMMPRTIDDLAAFAPPYDTLDAHHVSLWNRVADVWRQKDDLRKAVLRYASRSEALETASAELWPEVIYSLIERAHWQRTFRPLHEAIRDYVVGKLLRVPLSGVRLDRMMVIAIPVEVAKQLDEDVSAFVDDPRLDEDGASPAGSPTSDEIPCYVGGTVPADGATSDETQRVKRRPFYFGSRIPREELPDDDDAPCVNARVPLCPAEPYLFTQDILRNLWEAEMNTPDNTTRPRVLHETLPVGPYELAVIPTAGGRIRSAVRAVLQGMQQGTKQIEIFTPPALAKESASRTVIAIWIYEDASMAVVHLDFQYNPRYILWHAPDGHHFTFDYAEELKVRLSTLNLELPDRLDRILSQK